MIDPDTVTEPFWAAARSHRLVCQRCSACGTHRMPPVPVCWVCHSFDSVWEELPGTGTVYTFTVVRHALARSVANSIPYVIAVVDLEGAPGARLVGNIVESDVDVIHIGASVAVIWDDVSPEVTIPRFTLSAD
jgi:uncharacterized OB-fold protein